MQSFKQYLLKEAVYEGEVIVILYYTGDSLNDDDLEKLRNSKFKAYRTMGYIHIEFDADENVTDEYIDRLHQQVIKIIPHAKLKIENPEKRSLNKAEVTVERLPSKYTVDVTCSVSILNELVKLTSLKNILLYIKGAAFLDISKIENIRSNVLSLLKIKNLIKIGDGTGLDIHIDWVNIVNKHLKTKDIIECQEELIDNGLKDYAEL